MPMQSAVPAVFPRPSQLEPGERAIPPLSWARAGQSILLVCTQQVCNKGHSQPQSAVYCHRKDRREGEDLRQCGGTRSAACKDEVYQTCYLGPWSKKADENTEEDRAKRKKKAA